MRWLIGLLCIFGLTQTARAEEGAPGNQVVVASERDAWHPLTIRTSDELARPSPARSLCCCCAQRAEQVLNNLRTGSILIAVGFVAGGFGTALLAANHRAGGDLSPSTGLGLAGFGVGLSLVISGSVIYARGSSAEHNAEHE